MRVSYLELFVHCQKVFEACGIPYGCAEDGADAAAWGEFGGLSGLKVLTGELNRMQTKGMQGVQLLSEKEGFTLFDGGGQSGLLLGKAAAEYAYAESEKTETAAVYVQNTSTSQLFAQQAFYLASKGKGCIMHYETEEGVPSWIVSAPEMPYPVLTEGHHINNVIWIELNKELSNLERQIKSSDEFLLICTKKLELINCLFETLKNKVKEQEFTLIDSERMKHTLESSHQYGAEVDRTLWDELDKTGRNSLVESTELSRLRGAGELA